MNAPSRRVRLALAIAAAGLLSTGAGIAYLRQDAKMVSVDTAVEAFRASAGATTTTVASEPTPDSAPEAPGPTAPGATETAPPPASPTTAPPRATKAAAAPAPVAASPAQAGSPSRTIDEGVYTYATNGYEETNALGGSRHDYPAETAVTIRKAECGGWTQRWQPLQERWDESDLCPEDDGSAFSVRRFVTYHEFFQRSQQQEFNCPAGSHVSRRHAPPGSTWTWRCTAGASAIDTTVTVKGTEPIDVGGTTLDAIHIHYASKLTGGNRGTQEQHRWLHPDSGLNVKIVTDIDTEADSPFGAVSYVEHYTIALTSLTPRR